VEAGGRRLTEVEAGGGRLEEVVPWRPRMTQERGKEEEGDGPKRIRTRPKCGLHGDTRHSVKTEDRNALSPALLLRKIKFLFFL
jgi:hypothetical protein